MEITTIGYEKATQADVIATLRRAGVKRLIDVRDLPLSRRAGFSKNVLAASLAAEGIEYVHLKALGTPKEGRLANRRRDWETFWRIVDERLATAPAELDLQRAADLARETPSCLLCFEADHVHCHRRRVAELLAAKWNFVPRHLAVPLA